MMNPLFCALQAVELCTLLDLSFSKSSGQLRDHDYALVSETQCLNIGDVVGAVGNRGHLPCLTNFRAGA